MERLDSHETGRHPHSSAPHRCCRETGFLTAWDLVAKQHKCPRFRARFPWSNPETHLFGFFGARCGTVSSVPPETLWPFGSWCVRCSRSRPPGRWCLLLHHCHTPAVSSETVLKKRRQTETKVQLFAHLLIYVEGMKYFWRLIITMLFVDIIFWHFLIILHLKQDLSMKEMQKRWVLVRKEGGQGACGNMT